MSLDMPDGGGYRVAGNAHAHVSGRQRPHIIAISADWKNHEVRGSEADIERHLAKPLEPARLLSVIATLTQSSNGTRPVSA